MRRLLHNVLTIAVYVLLSFALMYAIGRSAAYPAGANVMSHIYKGDLIYRSIKSGDFYPLYDPLWYNGIEALRYWPPLPAYLLALCQALAGGSSFGGYILFNGILFLVSALSFLHVGNCFGRRWTGGFLGLIWFFTPCSLQLVYGQGNLARMLCLALLPLFLYYLERFMREGELHQMLLPAVFFLMFLLSEPYFAGILAITLLVYLVIYAAANRRIIGEKPGAAWRRLGEVAVMLLAVTLMSMLWLLPALTGRDRTIDRGEVLINYFQSGWHSLNPTTRFHEEMPGEYYYGLAAFLLAVFGLLCAGRRSTPGFATAIILFLGTTMTAYPLLRLMPGDTAFRMLNYLPIAACLILYALLAWQTIKRPVLVVVCLLLTLDLLPSLKFVFSIEEGANDDFAITRFAAEEERTLLVSAKQMTRQRLALIDLGSLESDGTYLVSAYDVPLAGSYGSDIVSAKTSYNITQINRACSGGQYPYLFDRALELGNDSVLVQMSQVEWDEDAVAGLDAAASRVGYALSDANEAYRLYHLMDAAADGTFGVVSSYGAIGIGSGAGQISLDFPTVEEVTSTNINDYSYEELSKYRTVYLNGFTYDDKAAAEAMLVKLSQTGTRIVVLADGIPQDPDTKAREFLGVMAQEVVFSNGYPELETTKWGVINADLFPSGYTTWRTVYMTGLTGVYGHTQEDGVTLDFYGWSMNENIVFLGINLTYHYALTKDASIADLLYDVFHMEIGEMPERRLVPMQVSYEEDRIRISSPEDDVNTALAWQAGFEQAPGARERNRLLHVDAGETEIALGYPMLWRGWILTGVGAALLALLVVSRVRAQRREESEDAA